MIFDDDDLHEEVEELFAEESRRGRKSSKSDAHRKPKFTPGHYDEKKYHYEDEEE